MAFHGLDDSGRSYRYLLQAPLSLATRADRLDPEHGDLRTSIHGWWFLEFLKELEDVTTGEFKWRYE